jgi:heme-degrading monooxygenase HmoA
MRWESETQHQKYQNTSTQSQAIKNAKTHKPRAKLQEIFKK